MQGNKYMELPDTLTPEESTRLIQELLKLPKPENKEDAINQAEAMAEVADLHWHTYVLLDNQTRNELDVWVSAIWDRNSVIITRLLISIIARIGLSRSMKMLQRELNQELDSSVRHEIMEAIDEFGDTVSDPYSGMKTAPPV
jgi:hypothetical protein